MIKKIFSLFAAILFAGSLMAADEVYKTAAFTIANCTKSSSYTGSVTCKVGSDTWTAANAANNNGKWDYIKMGGKRASDGTTTVQTGTIVTSASYSEAITKVVVNGSLDRGTVSAKLIYASNSSFTEDMVESNALTAFTSGKMTFTIASPVANRYYKLEFVCSNSTTTNGVISISSVEYYKEAGSSDPTACATPSFDPAAGAVLAGTEVEILCETEGATIHYTTDGTEPTASSPTYSSAITIDEAKTIKAIAVKSGLSNSAVATAAYTVVTPYTTISAFLTDQPSTDSYVQFEGTVVVTGVNGKNVYVQDEDGYATCLYFSSNSTWTKGHKVTGLFQAKYGTYGNQKQMVIAAGNEGTIAATVDADIPAPAEINTLAEATINENMNKYVTLKGVNFQNQTLTSKAVDLQKGSNTLKFYDNLNKTNGKVLPLTATACDVTGILISYKSGNDAVNEILPVDEACIVAGPATLPTLNPTGSTDAANPTMVKNGSAITVTPASGFTCTLNEENLTTATNVNITETESNTEIAVSAARDYYTTAEATYYFKADQPATKYAITVVQPELGGELSASHLEAEKDIVVSLTATPTNSHFTFDGWVVYKTGESSTEVEVTSNQFTMPDYAVTVTGSFTEDNKVTFSFAKGAEAATGDAPAAIANKYADDEITLPECPFTYAGYIFSGWKHSATEAIHQPGDYTVTAADATANAIVFTAQWKKLYTVTWNNNDDESVKTQVAEGQQPTLPETPTACDATSTTFYGWAEEPWAGKLDDISDKDVHTSASTMDAVSANVTYYAVFCKGGTAIGGITQDEIATDVEADEGQSGTYRERSYASASGNWTGTFAYNTQGGEKVMQITNTSGRSINSPTFAGNISKIEITFTNGSSKSRSFKLTNGDDELGTISVAGSAKAETGHADITGSYTSFTITAQGGALYIHSIRVTYGADATKFMTTCQDHTYTLAWSRGAGPDEILGELFRQPLTDSYTKAFDKDILHADTYLVKVYEDDETTPIATTNLKIDEVAHYDLSFLFYNDGNNTPYVTATASNPTILTGIDNTDATKKAVKFIENGQLFIELNGHIYNVQGQTVK